MLSFACIYACRTAAKAWGLGSKRLSRCSNKARHSGYLSFVTLAPFQRCLGSMENYCQRRLHRCGIPRLRKPRSLALGCTHNINKHICIVLSLTRRISHRTHRNASVGPLALSDTLTYCACGIECTT